VSIRLVRHALSVASAYRSLVAPEHGGVALFVGTVRPDRVRTGRVTALYYEAHLPVARRALERLERQARARFGLGAVVLWHRLGDLEVGEASVIVGAAAPHREAALSACRYLIETLKRDVPIWKSDRVRPERPRRRPRAPRRGR